MKSFGQIQKEAEKSDYTRVAEIVGMSPALVRHVVNGIRTDHHNIQRVFSDLLTHRERITQREERRRARIQKRNRMAA